MLYRCESAEQDNGFSRDFHWRREKENREKKCIHSGRLYGRETPLCVHFLIFGYYNNQWKSAEMWMERKDNKEWWFLYGHHGGLKIIQMTAPLLPEKRKSTEEKASDGHDWHVLTNLEYANIYSTVVKEKSKNWQREKPMRFFSVYLYFLKEKKYSIADVFWKAPKREETGAKKKEISEEGGKGKENDTVCAKYLHKGTTKKQILLYIFLRK